MSAALQRQFVGGAQSQPGSGTNLLQGVTCVASADCWAVGGYHGASVDLTLTEHYNAPLNANIPDAPWAPAVVLIGAIAALVRFRANKLDGDAAVRA